MKFAYLVFITQFAMISGFVGSAEGIESNDDTDEPPSTYVEVIDAEQVAEVETASVQREEDRTAPDPDLSTKDGIKAFVVSTAMALNVPVDRTVRIAQCESGFQAHKKNPSPNSSAYGVFQFINSTWITAATEAGFDPVSFRDDPEAQVIAGVLYMKNHGVGAWRADPRSPACWDK